MCNNNKCVCMSATPVTKPLSMHVSSSWPDGESAGQEKDRHHSPRDVRADALVGVHGHTPKDVTSQSAHYAPMWDTTKGQTCMAGCLQ